MPEVLIPGGHISFQVDGEADKPALLLSHALGTTRELWAPQMPVLLRHFRVIQYDTRGHGKSGAPAGEYTIEQLGRDALAVLDATRTERADICGLSLGGLTALWLARYAPHRVRRLVLANTAARIGNARNWQDRIDLIRSRGLGPVAQTGPDRWFRESFRLNHPDVVAHCQQMVLGCSPAGYSGCVAVLRDADLRPVLRDITAPTLVIVGRSDPVCSQADGDELRQGIAGAHGLELPASHFSNIEDAERFTNALVQFLDDGAGGDDAHG